jgi:hypothetical protein
MENQELKNVFVDLHASLGMLLFHERNKTNLWAGDNEIIKNVIQKDYDKVASLIKKVNSLTTNNTENIIAPKPRKPAIDLDEELAQSLIMNTLLDDEANRMAIEREVNLNNNAWKPRDELDWMQSQTQPKPVPVIGGPYDLGPSIQPLRGNDTNGSPMQVAIFDFHKMYR